MTKAAKLAMCAVVLAFGIGAARGDALSEQRKAQNKLLAARAARVEAIRKLAERIMGLQITAQTRVQDFVTESDVIQTELNARIRGMKEVSVKHLEDGTCEVTMEIKLSQIIATLKTIHATHYKGNRVKATDFQQMTTTNKITVLRETGSGVPREELIPDPLTPPAQGASQATFSGATPAARRYWAQYCTPRGRLMAERAARVDAMRKLAERLKGLQITASTTVADFAAESDDINTRLNTMIRGMKEVGRRYHKDELIVEVEMQIKLRQFYQSLKSWTSTRTRGGNVTSRQIQDAVIRSKDTIIREVGMGVPNVRYLKSTAPVAVRRTVAVASSAPAWSTQTIRATGNAAVDGVNSTSAAQAKLMAKRAAELDARRKLAERLNGLQITSNTSVQNFAAQNDQIGTSMLTFQQGARVVDETFKIVDGAASVDVEIELLPLWNSILYYQRTLSLTIR